MTREEKYSYVEHMNLHSALLESLEKTLSVVKLFTFLREYCSRQLVVISYENKTAALVKKRNQSAHFSRLCSLVNYDRIKYLL